MAEQVKVKFKAEGINQTKSQVNGLSSSFRDFGSLLKSAAVLGAITAITAALKETIALAAAQEDVFNRLSNQLTVVGESYSGATKKGIDEFLASMQATTKYGDTTVAPVLGRLTQLTGDLEASMQLTKIAFDLQASGMIEANSAALLLARAYQGDVTGLSRYIPALKEANLKQLGLTTSAEKTEYAMKILQDTFGGMAEGEIGTLNGSIEQLKNSFGDLVEFAGTPLLNPLREVVKYVNRFLDDILLAAKGVDSFTLSVIKLKRAQTDLTEEQKEIQSAIIDVSDKVKKLNKIYSDGFTEDERQRVYQLTKDIDGLAGQYLKLAQTQDLDFTKKEDRLKLLDLLTDAYTSNADEVAENAIAVKQAEALLAAKQEEHNAAVVKYFKNQYKLGRLTKEEYEDLSSGFIKVKNKIDDANDSIADTVECLKDLKSAIDKTFNIFYLENNVKTLLTRFPDALQKATDVIGRDQSSLITNLLGTLDKEQIADIEKKLKEAADKYSTALKTEVNKEEANALFIKTLGDYINAINALKDKERAGKELIDERKEQTKQAKQTAFELALITSDTEESTRSILETEKARLEKKLEQNITSEEELEIRQKIAGMQSQINDFDEQSLNRTKQLTQTFAGPFASALANNIGQANRLGDAFKGALNQLIAMVAEAGTLAALTSAFGGGSFGSLFGSFLGLSQGGPVYAASGTRMPYRGTDTVPAMLSPGEYVLPRSVVEQNQQLIGELMKGKSSRGGGNVTINFTKGFLIGDERKFRDLVMESLSKVGYA